VICEAAAGMGQLVSSLLEYAQIDHEDSPLQSIGLNSVLETVLTTMRPVLQENQARVICTSLPVIQGDRVQLQQVFQNLIGNSVKYRRTEEAPVIHITSDENAGVVIVSVRDNGMGIAPTDQEQIFHPLKRLHGREIPGTGIGLSVCQKIVERHGGRIWVRSEPGKGATFFVTLPSQ